MRLLVASETIVVEAGQMYLAHAGVPHAVLPGNHGTLVIVDVWVCRKKFNNQVCSGVLHV
jgi:mannose-6-phosphate isomerase-like protein (cupin superfamily)